MADKKKRWWQKSTGELLGIDVAKQQDVLTQVRQQAAAIRVGVEIDQSAGTVAYQGQTYSLPAEATVETIGQTRRRITATRVVATGVVALAWRKKQDDRDLFLTVEGEGWSFLADVNPKHQREAREVAAMINSWRPAASGAQPS